MAMMNLDFSSVPSREPIPEGVYEVQIAKVEETKSKTSGNPMLKVEFTVLEDPYNGRKVWANYGMTAEAMWKIQELFKSIGMPTDGTVEIDSSELIGLTCRAKIAQREYQGDIQNEIKKTM